MSHNITVLKTKDCFIEDEIGAYTSECPSVDELKKEIGLYIPTETYDNE